MPGIRIAVSSRLAPESVVPKVSRKMGRPGLMSAILNGVNNVLDNLSGRWMSAMESRDCFRPWQSSSIAYFPSLLETKTIQSRNSIDYLFLYSIPVSHSGLAPLRLLTRLRDRDAQPTSVSCRTPTRFRLSPLWTFD